MTLRGRIGGSVENGVHVFRGVPYGADTATRRWQPALQETAWRGVRDAFDYGPSAPQRGSDGPGSEDCLRLNIWTPALRDGAKRPVLHVLVEGVGNGPIYRPPAALQLRQPHCHGKQYRQLAGSIPIVLPLMCRSRFRVLISRFVFMFGSVFPVQGLLFETSRWRTPNLEPEPSTEREHEPRSQQPEG